MTAISPFAYIHLIDNGNASNTPHGAYSTTKPHIYGFFSLFDNGKIKTLKKSQFCRLKIRFCLLIYRFHSFDSKFVVDFGEDKNCLFSIGKFIWIVLTIQ